MITPKPESGGAHLVPGAGQAESACIDGAKDFRRE
jgi:hypothetical protein